MNTEQTSKNIFCILVHCFGIVSAVVKGSFAKASDCLKIL